MKTDTIPPVSAVISKEVKSELLANAKQEEIDLAVCGLVHMKISELLEVVKSELDVVNQVHKNAKCPNANHCVKTLESLKDSLYKLAMRQQVA